MPLKNVTVGKKVKIIEPVNLYGCDLYDDVFVGPFVEIQKDVVIKDRTRVQSHSFICSDTTIESDCFIGHGVMFINDKFHKGKLAVSVDDWESTYIEKYVKIGSNATILPVFICKNTIIGAGAVVTKDILKPGVYAGNPAVRIVSKK